MQQELGPTSRCRAWEEERKSKLGRIVAFWEPKSNGPTLSSLLKAIWLKEVPHQTRIAGLCHQPAVI